MEARNGQSEEHLRIIAEGNIVGRSPSVSECSRVRNWNDASDPPLDALVFHHHELARSAGPLDLP